MKNAVKMLLCLMLALILPPCAQAVECAAPLVELTGLEYYPAYVCDDETGRWSVNAYQADALMDRFWAYGMRNSSRAVVFHLAAEGDARTGVWTPVLRFYLIHGQTINARAVSVLLDGQRFDLAASSSIVRNGRYSAECITVPLNAQGMQVAASMQQAEDVSVRLIGDELYTLSLDRSATAERLAMEATSLEQLSTGMALLSKLGVDGYALWDLSAKAWEHEHGYRPAVTQGSVSDTLCETPLTDAMGMVVPENGSNVAEVAQEQLIAYGFLSGTPYWKFDEQAVQATLRAQKVLDRVPTGCFDQALLDAMAAGRMVKEESQPALLTLGDTAQIGLERYWFADGVSASANPNSLRSVVNTDNTFLVSDGVIRSLSPEELHLFMQLEASVICNGQYIYEAELACECDGGTELDTRLLPMAQARLLVYAEVPASLAMDEQAQWSIAFAENGERLVIDLK